MLFLKKLTPEWALRLSLGTMYLYSGIDIVRHPNSWTWAVRDLPTFISQPITQFGVERFLHFQGVIEIIVALGLLLWFVPRKCVKLLGLVVALEMVAIVIFVGLDTVTFRDAGLIGSGLALFLML